MRTEDTIEATIWVRFRVRDTGRLYSYDNCVGICQQYCDEVGLCVSVQPTDFVYTRTRGESGESGSPEHGARIGLINYPRFPSNKPTVIMHARELARRLGEAFQQYKVTVVGPDSTFMLELGADYPAVTENR